MTAEEALKYLADYSNYSSDEEIRLPWDNQQFVHPSDFADMILNEIDQDNYEKYLQHYNIYKNL